MKVDDDISELKESMDTFLEVDKLCLSIEEAKEVTLV